MPVIALLAPDVDGAHGEVCILTHIKRLPEKVFFFIRNRVPTFKMKWSKMAMEKYLGNTCPKCGLLTGEFFLHSEPGAVFFPENEGDARSLFIREIPVSKPIDIEASPRTGCGELILKYAKKLE